MIRKRWFGMAIVILMMLVPTQLLAEELPYSPMDEPSSLVGGSTINVWGSIIQVIVILIIIIALIVILVKFLAHRNKIWPGARSIQLLAGIHLGQHKSLQLVEIGRTIYVVGVGDDVRLIDKIEDEEEVAFILERLHSDQNFSVRGSLSQLMQRFQKKEHSDDSLSSWNDSSFQSIFDQQMTRMSNRRQEVEQMLQQYDGEEKRND